MITSRWNQWVMNTNGQTKGLFLLSCIEHKKCFPGQPRDRNADSDGPVTSGPGPRQPRPFGPTSSAPRSTTPGPNPTSALREPGWVCPDTCSTWSRRQGTRWGRRRRTRRRLRRPGKRSVSCQIYDITLGEIFLIETKLSLWAKALITCHVSVIASNCYHGISSYRRSNDPQVF